MIFLWCFCLVLLFFFAFWTVFGLCFSCCIAFLVCSCVCVCMFFFFFFLNCFCVYDFLLVFYCFSCLLAVSCICVVFYVCFYFGFFWYSGLVIHIESYFSGIVFCIVLPRAKQQEGHPYSKTEFGGCSTPRTGALRRKQQEEHRFEKNYQDAPRASLAELGRELKQRGSSIPRQILRTLHVPPFPPAEKSERTVIRNRFLKTASRASNPKRSQSAPCASAGAATRPKQKEGRRLLRMLHAPQPRVVDSKENSQDAPRTRRKLHAQSRHALKPARRSSYSKQILRTLHVPALPRRKQQER